MFQEKRYVNYNAPGGFESSQNDDTSEAGSDEVPIAENTPEDTPDGVAGTQDDSVTENAPNPVSEEVTQSTEGELHTLKKKIEEGVESLKNLIEVITSNLQSLLESWGFSLEDDADTLPLRMAIAIYTEDGISYIENPNTDDRVEIDSSYDSDENGELDQDEVEAYIAYLRADTETPNISGEQADMIEEIWRAQVEELGESVDSNTEMETVSDSDLAEANARPATAPESIAQIDTEGSIYNLKYRVDNDLGGNMLTSGFPGSNSEDSDVGGQDREANRTRIRSEHPDWVDENGDALGNAALDVMYGYTVHGIRHILSLSHGGDTAQGIRDLVDAGLIQEGEIEHVNRGLNSRFSTGNKRLFAEAFEIYRDCPASESFLIHCHFGSHRAVLTNLICYGLLHNCTREEAEIANGVSHDFLSHRESWDNMLSEAFENLDEIRAYIN